ncbi:MAG: hypothetical protein KDC71_21790, partial [Acidobacteria bacterium]|nr:hypothetical protein [Acidobacteriota bacterium]
VEGLEQSGQLTYLNLAQNSLTAVPDLASNIDLEALFLDHNQFGRDVCPALQALFHLNIDYVRWNPQNDGSELVCEVTP